MVVNSSHLSERACDIRGLSTQRREGRFSHAPMKKETFCERKVPLIV